MEPLDSTEPTSTSQAKRHVLRAKPRGFCSIRIPAERVSGSGRELKASKGSSFTQRP